MTTSGFTVDGVRFVHEAEYRRRIRSAMLRDPTLTPEGAHDRVVEEQKDLTESMTVINQAHADAASKGLTKGRGGRGEMPCPKCKSGTLHYSVSGYNGHMHGRCSTPDCFVWME